MNKKTQPIFKESQQHDFVSDIALADTILHFQPKTGIDDGVK